ncbi:MAG: hypothetical protein ABW278_04810 [Steroidobacteraceae bacterium]
MLSLLSSMYPDGLSATGAAVLRAGTALFAVQLLQAMTDPPGFLAAGAWLAAGALLLGFLTRVVAMSIALWAWLLWNPNGDLAESIVSAGGIGALALALIGGGAWSLDASLFGRRVIDLDQ